MYNTKHNYCHIIISCCSILEEFTSAKRSWYCHSKKIESFFHSIHVNSMNQLLLCAPSISNPTQTYLERNQFLTKRYTFVDCGHLHVINIKHSNTTVTWHSDAIDFTLSGLSASIFHPRTACFGILRIISSFSNSTAVNGPCSYFWSLFPRSASMS